MVMYTSLSRERISTLLFFSLCFHTLITRALASDKRADIPACCLGPCDIGEIVAENAAPIADGPTNDGSAGIGVEYECGFLKFGSQTSSDANTNGLKGKMVDNRHGVNWILTADTSVEDASELNSEYILDGTKIKLGTGALAIAAAAVAADLAAWNPSQDMSNNLVSIDGSDVNDWKIIEPETSGKADALSWAPQVTAPLPLAAINDLFVKAVAGQTSVLLPRGMSPASVTEDMLGFFSLILSYAKSADSFANYSPKSVVSIMPRTDFTSIFNTIRAEVPGSLYDIVKVLACYKNDGTGYGIDLKYTQEGSTPAVPLPNDQLDKQTYIISYDDEVRECTVQDWIQSIQNGVIPDALSVADQVVDGSIGGLGARLENVLDTSRAVPIFEFRRLARTTWSGMASIAINAEQAIIGYHRAYPNAARIVRKNPDKIYSHIKRQACSLEPDDSPAPTVQAIATTQARVSYACSNYAAPHESISDFCTCTNGASAPVALATGSNTGDNYVPCPYTVAPPLPITTTASPQGGNQLYPFVTTIVDGYGSSIIEECQSSITEYYGGFKEVMCAGDVRTITAPPSKPSVSVTLGMNKVLAGQLTSSSLYTSISSALETLCPSVTSGSTVTVPAGTHTIKGITYVEDDTIPPLHNGELLVSIDTGVYSDARIRAAMINTAAQSFATSGNATNCFNATWGEKGYEEPLEFQTIELCNIANFVGVHYYGPRPFGSDPGTGTQWLEPHVSFGVDQGGFSCDEILELLEIVLIEFAPEFAIEELEIGEAITAACEHIMS